VQQRLVKMHQNLALRAKGVASNVLQNLSRNISETEEHLLHDLFYARTFANCANWLAKLG
jgi:hypothetical protein